MQRSAVETFLVLILALALPAHAADDDAAVKLRSADAAVRLGGLVALTKEPRASLDARRAALRPLLAKLLARDASPAVRGAAARALARTEGDAALPALVAALGGERDAEAERRLPEAFEELTGDAARKSLSVAAFDAADPRRAALAAEALGHLPDAAGTADLVALLDSAPQWAVAAGACLGLGRVVDARAIPALLPRLRHPDAAVRSATREALVGLTGQDQGTDPVKWETWWGGAKRDFRFPDPGARPAPEPRGGTADRPQDDGAPTFARFFGVEIRRRRVAFLIDYSQSMWGQRRAKAEEELVLAVKGMPSTSTFAAVLFNEKVWWFRDGPLPARPQEKLDLVGYLAEQKTVSYTNICDALDAALGLAGLGPAARSPAPGLDEILILSDGYPNRGRITVPAKILESVRTLNAGRVVIDAVALGEGPGDLLPELAKQNGGKFVAYLPRSEGR